MSPDGSGQTNLTNTSGVAEEFPAWSFDGKELGYTTRDSLWIMKADGTNKQSIPVGHFPVSIAFKPNSSLLGYSRFGGSDYDIYVIERDGTTETRLINKPLGDYNVRWSPDGNKLCFVTHEYYNGSYLPVIYSANADGSGQVPLTSLANKTNSSAHWSPDGGQLVFADSRYGNSEIHVMNADGSKQTRLTNNIATDTSPVFSPDGSHIAFVSNRDGNNEIYVMNADGSGVARITNNPADDFAPDWRQSLVINSPSVSISDAVATESAATETGVNSATFTVTLSRMSEAPVTITYRSYDGTAVADADYTAIPSASLTFAPGEVSKTITVPVLDDGLDEANETFSVRLAAVGALIADQQGVATISDDDAPPAVSINDITITEGTKNPTTNEGALTSAVFTVTLSQASEQTLTVNYATINETASSGSDYSQQSGTLTFAPGQTTKTITVPVVADAAVEPDEAFGVALSLPSNATLSDNRGTATISNDDAAPTVLSFSPEIGVVGTSVTITGTNFTYPTVFFNGIRANHSSHSATEIIATVPTGATTGPITVTTPTASGSSFDSFIVLNTPPQLGSPTASPANLARGQNTTLSLEVTDSDGVDDLRYVHLMLAPAGSAVTPWATNGGLWIHFNAVERKLYPWNGSDWGTGVPLGSSGTLTTPQGTLALSPYSVASITNGYRFNIAFTPNPSFTGTFLLRALAQDSQPANGWDVDSMREGSVVTIDNFNVPAQVSSLIASPTSLTTGQSTLLRVDATDANGTADLRYVHMMLAPQGSAATPWTTEGGLWTHFNVVERKLYAWNGSGWGTGVTLGTSGTLTTPQGSINVGASSLTSLGNGYRIRLVFTPNFSFTGPFVLRALPQDTEPASNWDLNSLQEGSTVTIAAVKAIPQVSTPTASPTSLGVGGTTVLRLSVTDGNGVDDLRYVHLMLAPQGSAVTPWASDGGLWMHFNAVERKLYPWTGSDWGSGIAVGSSGTLTTPQGTLTLASDWAYSFSTGYYFTIAFTPNASSVGNFTLRALAQDTEPVNNWDVNSVKVGSNVTITAGANSAPVISTPTASPTSLATSETTGLSLEVTDSNGAGDLRYIHLMLAPVASAVTPWSAEGGLWMHFNALERKLYPWNGSDWGAGIAMGSGGTLATPQGTLTLGSDWATSITNGYRFNIAFTPNSNYTGAFVLRALAQDTQPVNNWDVDSVKTGSNVTILAPQASPASKIETAPSAASS